MSAVLEKWQEFLVWGSHPLSLPYVIALLTFAGGAILFWLRPQWATIPHELGHAFTALLLGRKLKSININQDSSGDTRTVEYRSSNPLKNLIAAPFRWVRDILVSFAGYPAPFLFAWGLIWLWSHHMTKLALLGTLCLLVFTLLYSRNLFGFGMIVLGIIVVSVFIWLIREPVILELAVLALAGGMASGGVKGIQEAFSVYKADRATSAERWFDADFDPQHSDARALARKTLIPQVVWLALFSAVGAGASLWTLVNLASAYR